VLSKGMTRWPVWMICVLMAAPAAGQIPTVEARIDNVATAYMEREKVPGFAVVAMRGDRLLINRAWGVEDAVTRAPMRVRAIQPFYSVSKQMTATIVLKLVEVGLIELDAPVADYLPEWFADEPSLRVSHLLRHTSGIPDFAAVPDVHVLEAAQAGTGSFSTLLDLVAPLPRRFAPGQRHAYSNTNYTALALIAERVSGISFEALQRTTLFSPLGLADTDECSVLLRRGSRISAGHSVEGDHSTLPPNLQPTFSGNGGVCGSAQDLALWMRSLTSAKVISANSFEEMVRLAPVADGYRPPYGLGLSTMRIAGRPGFSHGGVGDGWGAWVAHLPDERLTVVVLANRGWLWLTDAGVPIVRALLGDPDPPFPQQGLLTNDEQTALTGDFEDGLFEIRLDADGDKVIVSVPAFALPIELWKQDDGYFVARDRPDTFSLRLGGTAIEFDWAEHRSYLVRR
jgi:D-alanyl-D-alanine carboxypeptidase